MNLIAFRNSWLLAANVAVVITLPVSAVGAPLPAIGITGWEGNGQDVPYKGQAIPGADGQMRVKKNPDGTFELRTRNGDPKVWSSHRSEFNWGRQNLKKGVDYWAAFAYKPVETAPDGRHIFFQFQMVPQSGMTGCAGPTFEMQTAGNALVINRNVSSTLEYTCQSVYNVPDTAPAVGVWTKFVIHFRPGYLSSHRPITEIWRDGVKIVSDTGINSSPLTTGEYAKMGIYKWDNTFGAVDTRAAAFTPLYFGQGVDLKADADEALSAFK